MTMMSSGATVMRESECVPRQHGAKSRVPFGVGGAAEQMRVGAAARAAALRRASAG
ncbi:hypothetical protein ACU4HD_14310 [Cupriavidus basilensis]